MAKETAPLQSSVLLLASYDDETQEMDVTFRNGRTYTHPRVPAEVFHQLRDAGSPGQFYNENIRGKYT